MFIGEYTHSLDTKGRLNIPAKFRQLIGEENSIVVTRGLDSCLFVYTREEWEQLAKKLAGLPFSQQNSRAFARLMLAGAADCEIDKQGRIMVPEHLRTYAGLAKHVVVTGLYNRMEIWEEDTWQEYKAKAEANSQHIAESMAELGI